MSRSRHLLLMVLAVLLPACGGGRSGVPDQASTEGEAPRTVNVTMRDDFIYEPARLEVTEGETIEFVVVNEGKNTHEFLVGDDKKQREYEQTMRQGGHDEHAMEVTGVRVEPGGERSFVFKVPKAAGKLLFGCHEPGHYEGGMRGEFIYSRSSPAGGGSESEPSRDERHH
jgi:uncharacterized cupredoxin-like copper-binding protein